MIRIFPDKNCSFVYSRRRLIGAIRRVRTCIQRCVSNRWEASILYVSTDTWEVIWKDGTTSPGHDSFEQALARLTSQWRQNCTANADSQEIPGWPVVARTPNPFHIPRKKSKSVGFLKGLRAGAFRLTSEILSRLLGLPAGR